MRRILLTALASSGLVVGDCATSQIDESFKRVQTTLAERGGYAIDHSIDRGQLHDALLGDGTLDAEEAVRLALVNNLDLQAELDELGITSAELLQASLLPNPVLDASLRFVEAGGGEIIELGIAQNMLDVLLLPRHRGIAAETLAAAEARAASAVLDLASETRRAYRQYQAQLARVELYESVVDATYLAADMARRLREAGNIIELDVLQEQALYEEARLMLAEGRGEAMRRRDALNALLGVWGETATG